MDSGSRCYGDAGTAAPPGPANLAVVTAEAANQRCFALVMRHLSGVEGTPVSGW